jgi:hypothetical protein
MSSPQRYLNRYNISSTEINFIGNIKINQVFDILERSVENCERCLIRKKNHYCMQTQCTNK